MTEVKLMPCSKRFPRKCRRAFRLSDISSNFQHSQCTGPLVAREIKYPSEFIKNSFLSPILPHIVPMMNHHTMPKFGFGPYKNTNGVGTFYLPKILNNTRGANSKMSLEFSHAKDKKYATSIPLPADKLDSNKRYLVTFTMKDNENAKEAENEVVK